MTENEIANYYKALSNGEKGRFTAFLSLKLGGSPHTWQQKNIELDAQYLRKATFTCGFTRAYFHYQGWNMESVVLKILRQLN